MPDNRATEQALQRTRSLIDQAAELLIRACDEMVGDCNLEPSLGWTLSEVREGRPCHGIRDDREAEHDGREPDTGSSSGAGQ
jgi:hypothetical protein